MVVTDDQHFRELVGNEDGQGQRQPRQPAGRGSTAGHQAYFLCSPAPYKLLVQRPQIVGCAGSCPTSPRQCQQRSHFTASEGVTFTAIDSPATMPIADVMKTNFRSSPRLASASHSSPCVPMGTVSSTLACSDEPTWPASRSPSISLLTSSRAARMAVHLSSSAVSVPPISA